MAVDNKLRAKILIVDDEPGILGLLTDMLSERYDCICAGSAEAALNKLNESTFDIVLTDINMPARSGLEMIPDVKEITPNTVIVMISGTQTAESAITALRLGAFDYLVKPFDLRHIQ